MGIFQDFIDSRPGNFRIERVVLRELVALRDQGDPLAPAGFEGRTVWAILKVLGMTNLIAPPPQGQLMGYKPQTLKYDELPISPDTALIFANQVAIDDNFKELEEELIAHLDLFQYRKDLLPLGELGIILDQINAKLWLRPQVDGLAGFNAITGSVDFNVEAGTASPGFGTGGQEMLEFDGSQRLHNKETNLVGCPFTKIESTEKFWIYFYYHAQGATGFQTLLHCGSSTTDDPGWRLLFNGDPQFRLGDGSGTTAQALPTELSFDENLPIAWLLNIDLENDLFQAWANGEALIKPGRNEVALNNLTSYPITPSEVLKIGSSSPSSQSLPLNGDFMVAIGEGLVPDKLANEMTRLGIGVPFFPMTLPQEQAILLQRNIIHTESSFSVTGKYTKAVGIQLYNDGTDGTRGSLVASSGTLELSTRSRSTHTFTGLTPGNRYHIVTVSADKENLSEGRVTMPSTTREGAKFLFSGCWQKPTSAVNFADVNLMWKRLDAGRVLVSTGDDGYLDDAYQRLNSLPPGSIPETLVDFDAAEVDELGDWQVFSSMGQQMLLAPGMWSDHDAFGNDLDGTASNKAIAQQFHRERFGNTLSFVKPDQTYRSFVLNGCRFIITDQRSERVGAGAATTQMFDATQKTWVGNEIAAAVAADQVIFLFIESPINRVAPTPAVDWEVVTTERTEVWDLVIDNGGKDQTVIVVGDYHARGINLAAGPFGTDAVTTLPMILASRANHGSAESVSGDWPDYWNNGNNGYMEIDITESLPSVTVEVTPVVGNTPATTVNISLTIA